MFHFTVTDAARFLGKSAVTIRSWERQGLLKLPRDLKGDRKLSPEEVRTVAQKAHQLGRISQSRLRLIEATVTLLTLIEGDT